MPHLMTPSHRIGCTKPAGKFGPGLLCALSCTVAASAFFPRAGNAAESLSGVAPARPRPAEHITVRAHSDDATGHQPGGGLIHPEHGVKSVSSVRQDFISRQSPTATAYQLAAMLPGANVATSDALGLSPQTNLTVRGLNNDAIGYVLDGMPLNDVAFYSGYPSQFADNENYDTVSLAQGAADLDSPVLNAAGGLMNLSFRNPARKAGGDIDVSYGSYDTNREFIRLDTGEIGQTGLRGFVSYSHSAADNWRGPGRDSRHHVDFKLLREWGENHAALVGSWNSTVTSYYPQVSLSNWKRYGISGPNNLARHFDLGADSAGTDDYRLWRAPERTLYLGAPVRLKLSRSFFLTATPYAQGAYGNVPAGSQLARSGLWQGTQALPDILNLPNTRDGLATVRANYTQRSYRSGFNAALHWKTGWNEVVLGYWYDYSDDNEQQPFTEISDSGNAADLWATRRSSFVTLGDGRTLLSGSFHTVSQVNALYLGDHMTLLGGRLLIDAGFKEVMLTRNGTNNVPGPQYRANSNSAVPLPRLGLRYSFTPEHQIFLNATTNFRAPAVTALYNQYDPSSGETTTDGSSNVRNEYSIAEELGYRYTGPLLMGSLTLFNYNFTNRQIETLLSANGALVQSTINAGGQTSRGVDVEIGTRPWHHLSPYVSGEYLHATIDNDLSSGGDLLPTRGKRAVRSPTLQAAAGLTYDDGHIFGVATVHYTGRQYATFMNDQRIPDHTTGDLAIGYRFSDLSRLHHPTLRMNFINITNEHYLSGVADPTMNAHDMTGRYGTSIAGSSPDYYIGGGFAALFTASTGL